MPPSDSCVINGGTPGEGAVAAARAGGGSPAARCEQPRLAHRPRRLKTGAAGRVVLGLCRAAPRRAGTAQDFSRRRCEACKPEIPTSRSAQGDEGFSWAVTGTAAPSTWKPGSERPGKAAWLRATGTGPSPPGKSPMDCGHLRERGEETSSPGAEPDSALPPVAGSNSCSPAVAGRQAGASPGRPAAANAARERSRVQTLRHAFLELQKTLPSVPPDTKLSKLDVLLLATTYIAHLTRSLQDEEESPGEGLGTLRGDGYLHPVKKWPMRSRLYIGATGQFLTHSAQGDDANQGETSTAPQI
ncbi:transcription factor 24 [Pezoporus occidentalis]|uniref:transcription factor 24 n=1 Tax=Pezoporus occidentalis TaxID=407982 RepID=UPI002F908177